jgi:hypothetical protein
LSSCSRRREPHEWLWWVSQPLEDFTSHITGMNYSRRKRKSSWLKLRHYFSIWQYRPRKTTRLCHDSRCLGRDLNPGPLECKARVLLTPSWRYFSACRILTLNIARIFLSCLTSGHWFPGLCNLQYKTAYKIKGRAKHTARVGEEKNGYEILVRNPDGTRQYGRPICRWEDNIKRKILIFRDMTTCIWSACCCVHADFLFVLPLHPEDGGYVPPKHRLIFAWLHFVRPISHSRDFFIVTAVRTSNPTILKWISRKQDGAEWTRYRDQ